MFGQQASYGCSDKNCVICAEEERKRKCLEMGYGSALHGRQSRYGDDANAQQGYGNALARSLAETKDVMNTSLQNAEFDRQAQQAPVWAPNPGGQQVAVGYYDYATGSYWTGATWVAKKSLDEGLIVMRGAAEPYPWMCECFAGTGKWVFCDSLGLQLLGVSPEPLDWDVRISDGFLWNAQMRKWQPGRQLIGKKELNEQSLIDALKDVKYPATGRLRSKESYAKEVNLAIDGALKDVFKTFDKKLEAAYTDLVFKDPDAWGTLDRGGDVNPLARIGSESNPLTAANYAQLIKDNYKHISNKHQITSGLDFEARCNLRKTRLAREGKLGLFEDRRSHPPLAGFDRMSDI